MSLYKQSLLYILFVSLLLSSKGKITAFYATFQLPDNRGLTNPSVSLHPIDGSSLDHKKCFQNILRENLKLIVTLKAARLKKSWFGLVRFQNCLILILKCFYWQTFQSLVQWSLKKTVSLKLSGIFHCNRS